LTARFASADGVPAGARLLCAYPKFAQYKGSGNDRDASNFTCEE